MLVLSRRQDEFVQIGDEIVIKIVRTARGSVKIGIDAPQGVRVLRGEVEDRHIAVGTEDLQKAPLQRRLERKRSCPAV